MSVMLNATTNVARASRVAPTRASSPKTARAGLVCRASSASKTPKTSHAPSVVTFGRGVAFGAASLSVTLLSAPPAYAMQGVFDNPAVLGATCVAVCWGIPQTLGTIVLQKKEEAGRAKCVEWNIDVSDVEQGNWGRIRERIKQEANKRGEEMPKI